MKSKAFLHCSPRKDLRDRFCSGYVFVRSGGVWSEQQKLVAADAASGDQFGS